MLADFDPHGIGIMSTYKYGSRNLSHENEHLNVSSIQWLGIGASDIHDNILNSTDSDNRGLLKLSKGDRKKAAKMLENNAVLAEDGEEKEWRRDLQVMMMLGVKAEMEILEKGPQEDADPAIWLAQRLQASPR